MRETDLSTDVVQLLPLLRAHARLMHGGTSDEADNLVERTLTRAIAETDSLGEGTILEAWLLSLLKLEASRTEVGD